MSELNKSLAELEKTAEILLKSENSEELPTEGAVNNDTTADTGKDSGITPEQENNTSSNSSTNSEAITKSLDKKFDEIGTAVSTLESVIQKSIATQDDTMTVFAKSFKAIAQTQSLLADMVKSVSSQVTEFNDRMGILESQPQMRKSLGSVNILEKNFQKSAGLPQAQISKSQISAILSEELFKGNPAVTSHDVIGVESGAPLRADLETLIHNRINQMN